MFQGQFGRFTSDGRAYVIDALATPTPWTNVICNGRFGLVISHTGGGFSWLDNSQLNVVTRWDMDHVRDDRGKFLFVSDLDQPAGSREVWSLAPQPCLPAYDRFACVHEPGRTRFETSIHGIDATWSLGCDAEANAELWHVELTNRSGRARRLRLASYLEWCCGVAPDVKREFHRLFFTVTHDRGRHAVLAAKHLWEAAFGGADDHWNRSWPYVAAHAMVPPEGVATWAVGDKPRFLGRFAPPARPSAMTGDAVPEGGFGRFNDAIGSVGCDLELAPGETVCLGFVLATERTAAEVRSTLDRYGSAGAVASALERSVGSWDGHLSASRVRTQRPEFDLLNNTWLRYQAISGRLWGRTGYYQQSGAFGFRDQLQDSQVWLPIDPARTREQILLHARHQFTNGEVYHWWHPVNEQGLKTACSDDLLWLAYVTASYVRETGDLSILDAAEPFVDALEERTPLLDHCERAMRRSFSRVGPLGMPLIGDMDWNDGLSHVGDETRGESVWMAFFLRCILLDWSVIYGLLGREGDAASCRSRADDLAATANAVAWDGAWFRRATKKDGSWLGGSDSLEGRIFLNAQTWAIFAGAADESRLSVAWESVREHLLTEFGPLLLAPAYTTPDASVGYITRYAPGARENGGVYMHAATWALKAACMRRDAGTATRIWESIAPPLRSGHDAERYAAEPYVVPGNVDGPLSPTPGRAGWTWYTGSAAWLNRVSLEWIAGVRATWAGLRVDPCPIEGMGRVEVVRRYRGRDVRVRFDGSSFASDRSPVLVADGEVMDGCVLAPEWLESRRAGTMIDVEVTWASAERESAAGGGVVVTAGREPGGVAPGSAGRAGWPHG